MRLASQRRLRPSSTRESRILHIRLFIDFIALLAKFCVCAMTFCKRWLPIFILSCTPIPKKNKRVPNIVTVTARVDTEFTLATAISWNKNKDTKTRMHSLSSEMPPVNEESALVCMLRHIRLTLFRLVGSRDPGDTAMFIMFWCVIRCGHQIKNTSSMLNRLTGDNFILNQVDRLLRLLRDSGVLLHHILIEHHPCHIPI